ncbi:hypothetical protein [Microbacterium sp. GXF7504]
MNTTMSITAPPPPPSVAPTWAQVDRGFFVASTEGRFIGSVDRTSRGRYLARDGQAAKIGVFATMVEAQQAVIDRS